MSNARRPVVLDTDVGSDVDDILALTMLIKAPEVDLVGVTTVYGDTHLRARIARFVCDALGTPSLPVIAGERETLTSRPIWWAGHEGEGIPGLDQVRPPDDDNAPRFLQAMSRQYEGSLEIIAIGPLTNLARALLSDPAFARRIHCLTLMGGVYFSPSEAEHNIKCDPEAAQVVFQSGIPIVAVGLDVTRRVWLRPPQVTKTASSNGRLGPVLAEQIHIWWRFLGSNANNPHDPLAVLAMLRPDLFTFERAGVIIGLSADDLARTLITRRGEDGVTIAADVDVAQAEAEIVRRIIA